MAGDSGMNEEVALVDQIQPVQLDRELATTQEHASRSRVLKLPHDPEQVAGDVVKRERLFKPGRPPIEGCASPVIVAGSCEVRATTLCRVLLSACQPQHRQARMPCGQPATRPTELTCVRALIVVYASGQSTLRA